MIKKRPAHEAQLAKDAQEYFLTVSLGMSSARNRSSCFVNVKETPRGFALDEPYTSISTTGRLMHPVHQAARLELDNLKSLVNLPEHCITLRVQAYDLVKHNLNELHPVHAQDLIQLCCLLQSMHGIHKKVKTKRLIVVEAPGLLDLIRVPTLASVIVKHPRLSEGIFRDTDEPVSRAVNSALRLGLAAGALYLQEQLFELGREDLL